MKYFLSIFLFFWTLLIYSQTTLLEENFDTDPTLFSGWTNVNNGGTTGQIWQFAPTSNGTITAGNFSGNYAVLDSDAYENGNNQNATLTTPEFSTSIYETVTLEYDYQYRDYQSPESCVVEVFNGTTWVSVANYTTNSGDNYVNLSTGASKVTLDITTQANGATDTKVRFTYIGNWDWWWAIDNVKVTGFVLPSNTTHLGPGGVGGITGSSDLVLWSKAENITAPSNLDPVETWLDASGYGSDLTQPNVDLRPLFLENFVNGYPAVRFDATAASNSLLGKRLVKTNFTNFPTSAISGFYVNKTESSTEGSDGVLSYASSTSRNNDFLLFNSNNLTFYRNNLNRTSGLDTSNANWNIVGFRWQSAGGVAHISNNGTESGALTPMNSGVNIFSGGSLALAGEQDSVDNFGTGNNDGNYNLSQSHQGDFSEVIIYNTFINQAKRIIVSNYLSAKYNIGITAGTDFYLQDNSGSGNFDFDVAGIGQATDGSNHTDSQGTGIIRMYNPSNLGNDEFLFWGRDNKDSYTFSTNTGNYKERISTKWRVSKRNDVGNVTVVIDLNGIDMSAKQACASLKLVVDNNSDLVSPTTTYELTDVGSGFFKAENVVFANNDFFTIEYIDKIVVDGTQFYNGSGTANVPSTSDDCYKLLVKNTATGSLSLTENADVREVEVESGGKLVIDSEKGLQVTNNILLNGEIRLLNKAQLLQIHSGTSTVTGVGNLFVDQDSEVVSKFLYNYFSSPVVTNGASNYTVASVMNDGTLATSASSTALSINYISELDGSFSSSPIAIPNRWIYTYDDIGSGIYAYDNNSGIGSTKTISPGKGYLFKGPGRPQNYTFVGTPNDGNYLYPGIPANVNILLGNPYASAFNIQEFLSDNAAIGTTVYLWQQAAVDNPAEGHLSGGYNGDYATINSSTSTAGTLPSEVTYVLEAEDATLGGSAVINGNKVDITTAADDISFDLINLTKTVDSLFIAYSSNALKTIDIDVNAVTQLSGVNLPNTFGVLDTIGVVVSIAPADIILIKSNDANTSSIDNIFVKQKFTNTAPPFNYFAIGQGFFFLTDIAGTLEFNNSQRAFIPEGTGGSFFFKGAKQKNDLSVLKLGMNFSPAPNQVFHKQIAISFKQGNSFNYDRGFDSTLLESQMNDIYWKFPEDDNFYSIAGVQEISEDLEVPLEIVVENSQTISITIDELQNIQIPIYLKDTKIDTSYTITNESAKIALESGTHSNRFYLAFKEPSLSTEESLPTNSIKIQHNRKLRELSVKNTSNSIIKKIVFYSILGQNILEIDDEATLQEKEISINTKKLKSAIYIVSIETNLGIITKKFF